MKKILIVDDDRGILEALHLILESEGYFVKTASNAQETFESLENFQPDVVLLDVLLSGEDGRDICKKIKKTHTVSSTPVLMMSAHISAKDSSITNGADGFLAKPFGIGELLEKIAVY